MNNQLHQLHLLRVQGFRKGKKPQEVHMQSSELTSSPQSPNVNSIRLDPSFEFLRRVEASRHVMGPAVAAILAAVIGYLSCTMGSLVGKKWSQYEDLSALAERLKWLPCLLPVEYFGIRKLNGNQITTHPSIQIQNILLVNRTR